MNPWLRAALQAVAGLALLAVVVRLVGTGPFREALGVLTPASAAAALALGAVATVAQALRWRAVVVARSRTALTRRAAVGECYRAGLLNAVLPGGLAGDALRAHRARRGGGWLSSAASVGLERLAGTALLLAVGAAVLAVAADGVNPVWWVVPAVAAAALVVLVVRSLRGSTAAVHLAVWGWSAVVLAALVALFVVAAGSATGSATGSTGGTAVLAVLALLGMSVPVGVGGFGPREAVAAAASAAAGTTPSAAVALTAGYGVLAVLSVAPGALLLLADLVLGQDAG